MNVKLILITAFSKIYGLFEMFMGLRQKGKREISRSGDKGSVNIDSRATIHIYCGKD
jgi:hypothetical protein